MGNQFNQEEHSLSDNSDSSIRENLSTVSENILKYLYNDRAYRTVSTKEKMADSVISIEENNFTEEEIAEISLNWKNRYTSWQVEDVDIPKLDRQQFLLFQQYLLEYEKTAEERRDREKVSSVSYTHLTLPTNREV